MKLAETKIIHQRKNSTSAEERKRKQLQSLQKMQERELLEPTEAAKEKNCRIQRKQRSLRLGKNRKKKKSLEKSTKELFAEKNFWFQAFDEGVSVI